MQNNHIVLFPNIAIAILHFIYCFHKVIVLDLLCLILGISSLLLFFIDSFIVVHFSRLKGDREKFLILFAIASKSGKE